jgi:hypothetical protein
LPICELSGGVFVNLDSFSQPFRDEVRLNPRTLLRVPPLVALVEASVRKWRVYKSISAYDASMGGKRVVNSEIVRCHAFGKPAPTCDQFCN